MRQERFEPCEYFWTKGKNEPRHEEMRAMIGKKIGAYILWEVVRGDDCQVRVMNLAEDEAQSAAGSMACAMRCN